MAQEFQEITIIPNQVIFYRFFIAQPLSLGPNCALYREAPVWGKDISPNHTINNVHLT